MNKLLKIALVLGLIKAFQLHGAELPPLPIAPVRGAVCVCVCVCKH